MGGRIAIDPWIILILQSRSTATAQAIALISSNYKSGDIPEKWKKIIGEGLDFLALRFSVSSYSNATDGYYLGLAERSSSRLEIFSHNNYSKSRRIYCRIYIEISGSVVLENKSTNSAEVSVRGARRENKDSWKLEHGSVIKIRRPEGDDIEFFAHIPRRDGQDKISYQQNLDELCSITKSSPTLATLNNPSPTFSPFSRLPREIRYLIWGFAYPGSDFLHMGFLSASLRSLSKVTMNRAQQWPGILLACHESHKIYKERINTRRGIYYETPHMLYYPIYEEKNGESRMRDGEAAVVRLERDGPGSNRKGNVPASAM